MSGAVNKFVEVGSFGIIDDFTGADAASDAARKAAEQQAKAGKDAIAFQRETRDLAREDLQPFREFGGRNIGRLQNMLTPQGQVSYLRANPIFNMALENANRQTNNAFLGQGLTGDARQALANNTLLAAQPLLQQQTGNLFNAVNMGQSAAAGQANTALNTGSNVSNLLTQIGNSQAAGTVGAQNAYTAATQGLLNLGGQIGGAAILASDRRLKDDIKRVGTTDSGLPVYTYRYKDDPEQRYFMGVMADEVEEVFPDAVGDLGEYKGVDYSKVA